MSRSGATLEERFSAAVDVIQSLPKNGPFQPSHDMQLRFYAFFKRARFGKCKGSRPGIWDVVGRAKWDAWKKLDHITTEEAMEGYVEELKKVVETMPHTDQVATFLDCLGSFYEPILEEEVSPSPDVNSAPPPQLPHNKPSNVDIASDASLSEVVSTLTSDEEDIFYDTQDAHSHGVLSTRSAESLSSHISKVSATQVLSRLEEMEIRLTSLSSQIHHLEQRLQSSLIFAKQSGESLQTVTFPITKIQATFLFLGVLGWPVLLQLLFHYFSRRRKSPL